MKKLEENEMRERFTVGKADFVAFRLQLLGLASQPGIPGAN